MGMAYICINIIYDFAEVLTKFLTCGKCKVRGYFKYHHCHIIITTAIVPSTTRALGGRLWLSYLSSFAS